MNFYSYTAGGGGGGGGGRGHNIYTGIDNCDFM